MKKVIIGVLIILMTSMAFIACEPPPEDDGKLRFSVTADGSGSGGAATEDTTTITVTFTEPVEEIIDLVDITVEGVNSGVNNTSGITLGVASYKSGSNFTQVLLPVSGFATSGWVTVYVDTDAIAATDNGKTVWVHKVVVGGPVEDLVVTANGTAGVSSTSQLTLTFAEAFPDLDVDEISVDGVSGVVLGTLTPTDQVGKTYTLGISGFTTGGTLTVSISREDPESEELIEFEAEVTIIYVAPVVTEGNEIPDAAFTNTIVPFGLLKAEVNAILPEGATYYGTTDANITSGTMLYIVWTVPNEAAWDSYKQSLQAELDNRAVLTSSKFLVITDLFTLDDDDNIQSVDVVFYESNANDTFVDDGIFKLPAGYLIVLEALKTNN